MEGKAIEVEAELVRARPIAADKVPSAVQGIDRLIAELRSGRRTALPLSPRPAPRPMKRGAILRVVNHDGLRQSRRPLTNHTTRNSHEAHESIRVRDFPMENRVRRQACGAGLLRTSNAVNEAIPCAVARTESDAFESSCPSCDCVVVFVLVLFVRARSAVVGSRLGALRGGREATSWRSVSSSW